MNFSNKSKKGGRSSADISSMRCKTSVRRLARDVHPAMIALCLSKMTLSGSFGGDTIQRCRKLHMRSATDVAIKLIRPGSNRGSLLQCSHINCARHGSFECFCNQFIRNLHCRPGQLNSIGNAFLNLKSMHKCTHVWCTNNLNKNPKHSHASLIG